MAITAARFRFGGALRAALILVAIACALSASLCMHACLQPVPTGADEERLEAEMQEWLRALGAPDYEEREQASEQFLARGEVAAAFLKKNAQQLDPEIRTRVRWLLKVLAPERARVHVFRVGPGRSGEAPAAGIESIREWLALEVLQDEQEQGSTTALDGSSTRIVIGMTLEADLYEISIDFQETNRPLQTSLLMQKGECALLNQEQILEVEWSEGVIERQIEDSIWILWLEDPTAGPPSSPHEIADLAPAFHAVLERQLKNNPAQTLRRALRIANLWPRFAELPDPEKVPAELLPDLHLARASAGDLASLEFLQSWIVRAKGDEGVEETHFLATLLLLRKGCPSALPMVLEEISRYQGWVQFQALCAVSSFLETTRSPADLQTVLAWLASPRVFEHVDWRYPEGAHLLQLLQRRLPAAEFRSLWLPFIAEGTSSSFSDAKEQSAAIVRGLKGVLDAGGVEVDAWAPSMIKLLETHQSTAAFLLLRDSYLAGKLGEDYWGVVLQKLEPIFATGSRSNTALDEALQICVSAPTITPAAIRRIFLLRLECFKVPKDPLKSKVDSALTQRFGPLPGKLSLNDTEGWERRGELWRALIATADDAQLLGQPSAGEESPPAAAGPAPPDGLDPKAGAKPAPAAVEPSPTVLRMTEVDFRVDAEEKTSRLIAFRSRDLTVGVAYPECGADLADRTALVQAAPRRGAVGRASTRKPNEEYDLASGDHLLLGIPRVERYRAESTYRRSLVSAANPAPAGLPDRRTIRFDTLLLLELPADSLAAQGWQETLARVLAALPSLADDKREAWNEVIRQLDIYEALAVLQALYEKEGDPELARTLLELGDERGQELLLQSIAGADLEKGRNLNQHVQRLEELIARQVPEAVALAITWLNKLKPTQRHFTRRLLVALATVLDSPNSELIQDQEQLLEALVHVISTSDILDVAVPLLERQSGQDFGVSKSPTGVPGDPERKAENNARARVQKWWAERQKAPDKTPPK